MVIFGQQDLSRSAPFPRIDLVLCRNVLIYFTPELQDYVLNQFAFSLSDSGFLFLGKAETVRPAQPYYELVNKQWKIYRCTSTAVPVTRRQVPNNMSKLHPDNNLPRLSRIVGKASNSEEQVSPPVELGQLRRVNELMLRFLPIGLLVIDRNYRLLTSNGAARRLLGLREIANEQDFLHSVRGIPYSLVRTAIDSVFRERTVANLPEVELDPTQGGNGRFLAFSIAMMQMEGGMPDLAVISVSDVTEQVETRRQLETVQAEQSRLMTELGETNRRLNDLNKELTDANEELQVSNEELMLTHEELQASIEEFETTNEELQATNEELETNNEELQATNEELQTTNDELRARTNDLQESTSVLESERARLSEMVESAPFYIMLLRGPELIVEAYNPRYNRMLHTRQMLGLPLAEITELFMEDTNVIVDLAREAYRQDASRTSPSIATRLSNTSGETTTHNFVYTIVPSHDANRRVMGVIIYGVDQDSNTNSS